MPRYLVEGKYTQSVQEALTAEEAALKAAPEIGVTFDDRAEFDVITVSQISELSVVLNLRRTFEIVRRDQL